MNQIMSQQLDSVERQDVLYKHSWAKELSHMHPRVRVRKQESERKEVLHCSRPMYNYYEVNCWNIIVPKT